MTDGDAKVTPPAAASEQSNRSKLLTGTEREALVNEIVNEIRKDSVKQDALIELKKADWRELISKFFQHPAVLLFMGFVITGIIGGWLANRWQSQEWDRQLDLQSKEWNRQREIQRQEWERQQIRLLDINEIGLKYKLIEEITKAIGERNSAAMGIVAPLTTQEISVQQLNAEEAEPIKNWQKATNDWRVNSQIIKLKIETYIKNPRAAELFKEIIDKQRTIFANVNIVKNNLRQYNLAYREIEDDSPDSESGREERHDLDVIRNDIEKTGQVLKLLTGVIAEEARSEVKSSGP